MSRKIIMLIILITVIGFKGQISISFAETAEDNYKLYCAQCHGLKGNGNGINKADMATTPRDHTSLEMAKLKDSDMYYAISQGGAAVSKSTLMPAWNSIFTDEEIKDMIKYLRKLCNCKGE